MRALSLSIAVALLFLLSSASVHAQDKKAAEKAFIEAQKHYDAGEYKEAVKGFIAAYTMVPANPLLFNIGQAYRLSGEPEKALSYYEKYVAFEPGGAQVAEAKEHIQKLKEDVETAKHDKERSQAEMRAKAEAEERARADEQRKSAELAQRQRDAETAGSGLRTGGLVVGGLGVAALGAGIAVAAGGTKGAGFALVGVGAAGVIAGTTMYIIGRKKRSQAMASAGKTAFLVPEITGDTVGVAWIVTF